MNRSTVASVACVWMLLGCAHARPVVTPARPVAPFYTELRCFTGQRCFVGERGTSIPGSRLALRVQSGNHDRPDAGKLDASDGYRYRVLDRTGTEVLAGPIITQRAIGGGYTHAMDLDLVLAAGDYEIEILGGVTTVIAGNQVKTVFEPNARTLLAEVRVAAVKTLGGTTRLHTFLHHGTRVWLDAKLLTVARFWPAVRTHDPVIIEWLHDGKLVTKTSHRRSGNADPKWRLGGRGDATPWRYGETYRLPPDLATRSGHWTARIHAFEQESVEVDFDIAGGTLVMKDERARWQGRFAVASPTLPVRSVATDRAIQAELARLVPAFDTPHESIGRAYAAAVPMSPELVRARTRDPKLDVLLDQFEATRHPQYMSGGRVERVCAGPCPELSPEQDWRYQRRARREISASVDATNARRKAQAPKLRAEILRLIAAKGHPFAQHEIPPLAEIGETRKISSRR